MTSSAVRRIVGRVLLGGLLAGGSAALAGEVGLDALPPVTRAPWRFEGFPIIAWWGPPGTARREDFEAYRDAGFTLHATNPDEGFERALAHVEAVGLRSMVFRQHQGFVLAASPDVVFPAGRDAVVGWIVADEPSGQADVGRAVHEVNALMRRDPARWAFFNMLSPSVQGDPPTDAVVDAAVRAGMPLLSYDTYAIMRDGSDRAERFYAHLEQFRRASLRHGVSFWAFALTIGHFDYRRPSESDLRWQHYSNLAYGAKGLWYFTYWGPTSWQRWDARAIVDPADGSPTELYPWVQTLNRAVLEVGDVLLRLTSAGVVHGRPPAGQRPFEPGRSWITELKARDALVGFFTSPGGDVYALVVNKLHGMGQSAAALADRIELTFSDRVRKVEAVSWLDGVAGPLTPTDGKVSLTVHGGTGVLLRAETGAETSR